MQSLLVFTIIFAVLIFVGYKTWREIMDNTEHCNQDCNQGRKCTCKERSNED